MAMRWTDTARIQATPELVWQLTTDLAGWPAITPTVRRVDRLDDGPLRVGSCARVRQPGQLPAVWTVTELDPGRRFVWQTRRPGLVMVATHQLEPDGDGCRNTLLLDAAGLLARPVGLLLGPLLRNALRVENAGFTRAAEAARATGG
jgi:hypothetical protein